MTLQGAYQEGKDRLSQAGIEEAALDAWYLLEFVTGIDRAHFYAGADEKISDKDCQRYQDLISRRAERVPLQHLTGVQDFMGLTFKVNEDVLIPRQDTETLVENALEMIERECVPLTEGKLKILDMCTGSGCILLSVLIYAERAGKAAEGTGADLSEAALQVAEENAERLGRRAGFIKSDLFASVAGRYGMILSNPPYIRTKEIEKLQDEVKLHDPGTALDGGEDGLYFYRRITREAGAYLEPGGVLMFEIGWDQAEDVRELMEQAGFRDIKVKKDLPGLDRVVYGVYCKQETVID